MSLQCSIEEMDGNMSASRPFMHNTTMISGAEVPAVMRAITNDRYGSPQQLAIKEIATPAIGDKDVLVRVRASALHIGDCFGVRGSPFLMRLHSGLLKPKHGVSGFDMAGTVAQVGNKVSRFQVGDEVFGECAGGCAEFTCAPETTLTHKPTNITFEQAAAVTTSALAALHALRDVAAVKPGDRVLINGASGGIGTFAIQLAKLFGAQVTAVCSTGNRELVLSSGADDVIDYTQQDFTQAESLYDVIFDNVENRALSDCRKALKEDGLLILNSGTGATGLKMLLRIFKPLLLSPFVKQNLRRYLSMPNQKDLEYLSQLLESGQLRPVIDRVCSLDETSHALEYIESGRVRGKVIIAVN